MSRETKIPISIWRLLDLESLACLNEIDQIIHSNELRDNSSKVNDIKSAIERADSRWEKLLQEGKESIISEIRKTRKE